MSDYIYLIRCNDFVKIGIADNVRARLSAMQTGNPYAVELLHAAPVSDARRIEAELHQQHKACWVRGEWFRLTDEQIDAIKGAYAGTEECETVINWPLVAALMAQIQFSLKDAMAYPARRHAIFRCVDRTFAEVKGMVEPELIRQTGKGI